MISIKRQSLRMRETGECLPAWLSLMLFSLLAPSFDLTQRLIGFFLRDRQLRPDRYHLAH